jgi:hypothetical protein
MNVPELYQQIQALSPQERQQLFALLRRLNDEAAAPDEAWTSEEVQALLQIEPSTGAEIVAAGLTGGWAEQGIEDGAEWVAQQRQRQRRTW